MRHGASTVIFGRTQSKLENAAVELAKATGQKCIAVSGDVRNPEDCNRAVAVASETYGQIDILVNGAAGYEVSFFLPA